MGEMFVSQVFNRTYWGHNVLLVLPLLRKPLPSLYPIISLHILLQHISRYLTLFSSTLLLILLFFLPPSERLL